MTTYICPFCNKDLIYTGKREFETFWNDCGASFFKCGCVVHYEWGDALPSNKWKLCLDGTWWYWKEAEIRLPMWENMTAKKKPLPFKKVFLFR